MPQLPWTVLFLLVSRSFAQEATPTPTPTPSDLERKVEVLTQEVEHLKAGEELFPEAKGSDYGFGPAASKVYRTKKGVSIGGYGEFVYQGFASEDEGGAVPRTEDQIDLLKAVLYTGYKFNDRFLFNSEIEFEHASTEGSGEVSVEFAYIDFLWRKPINFRAGLMLLPMGLINELHEPSVYLGVLHPDVEERIIPATWSELGAGLFGSWKDFTYRAYFVSGLNATGAGTTGTAGFDAQGIREGRQGGSEALANTWAFVGRGDYTGVPDLLVGASGYIGSAGQGAHAPTGEDIRAMTSILDLHADYRHKGARFRGLFTYGDISDVALIDAAKGLAGSQSVGEKLLGYYVEYGYDVLTHADTDQELIPFMRHEWLNTQHRVPAGFSSDPSTEEKIETIGLQYQPIMNIALKGEYQFRRTEANNGVNQMNFSLGYLF